jgi:anti-sigma factor RsiW
VTAPLACVELVELVTDYLDGALDDETAERVRAHLQLCEGCREYVEQIRRTASTATALTEDELDPTVRARLLAAFRDFHRDA